ncbi:MAG: hypothetical protein MK479_01255 [Planctomycetes bacterium]|nr:hypothetical protein [Planctomycetota bacterium]
MVDDPPVDPRAVKVQDILAIHDIDGTRSLNLLDDPVGRFARTRQGDNLPGFEWVEYVLPSMAAARPRQQDQ